MFGLGTPELLVIGVIAVFLFGAKKLPELGSSFGKALKGFKEGIKEEERAASAPQPEVLSAARTESTVEPATKASSEQA
nr:twin-arginine translocase TatA/TatE family subunit [Anthocerotibacter panamensis]